MGPTERRLSPAGTAGEEEAELRRCVRELAALSTLSAAWGGADRQEIAEGLCRVLVRSLPVALGYVRVLERGGALEVASSDHGRVSAAEARAVGQALASALWPGAAATVTDPLGGETLRVLSVPLGFGGDCGVVAVGSARPGFPSQTDRLLVGVAANQAAVVLQQKGSADERALAETGRARLAAIVESSDDAILGIDREGFITSWNRGAERIYGYAAAEAIGKPVSFLIPPDRPDDFPLVMDRLRRGERIEHYETERVARDGTRVEVSLTISPIRDGTGAIVGASKIVRDITEQKRTAAALRTQTERLRLLWEAAAVLLTAEDPDAMLRGLLDKIGPHLGVDASFNYGVNDTGDGLRLVAWAGAGLGPPHDLFAGLDFGQQALLSRPPEPEAVGHIGEAEGPAARALQSLGIRAYVTYPLQAGERLLGALVFASRTRDEFDATEVGFMRTICHYATVAYERLRLVSELRDADRRKDEFLAVLAHELRNPLAPVRNAVQVLRLKGPDEPQLRWGRDVILRQVQHLTRLIDDLMDVSRITRDKLELRKERVDLAEVVRGAVESSRPVIEEWRHELAVSLPAHPIHLYGDLVRLSQVFLNLLNNAAKYTEPGGRIWLAAEASGDEVVVSVRDTGMGIPPETLPRLFQMFFQVDRTLERAQGGLGIGLALVRRLVELHGGRIEARSGGPGKGSEFVVRLPILAEGATDPAAAPAGVTAANRTARRILVVDDNRDSADSLAMLLRINGNEVETAYDGEEGVLAAERFRPDVALFDIGMPRLNGEEACRRIRAEPWGAHVLLVALTGWATEADRLRTVAAGFDAHVVKPIDPSALPDLLARAPRRSSVA